MDEWMDRRWVIDGWWIDGWMDGWTDRWVDGCWGLNPGLQACKKIHWTILSNLQGSFSLIVFISIENLAFWTWSSNNLPWSVTAFSVGTPWELPCVDPNEEMWHKLVLRADGRCVGVMTVTQQPRIMDEGFLGSPRVHLLPPRSWKLLWMFWVVDSASLCWHFGEFPDREGQIFDPDTGISLSWVPNSRLKPIT